MELTKKFILLANVPEITGAPQYPNKYITKVYEDNADTLNKRDSEVNIKTNLIWVVGGIREALYYEIEKVPVERTLFGTQVYYVVMAEKFQYPDDRGEKLISISVEFTGTDEVLKYYQDNIEHSTEDKIFSDIMFTNKLLQKDFILKNILKDSGGSYTVYLELQGLQQLEDIK